MSSSPRPSSKNAQKGSPISTASSSTLTAKSDAKGGNLKLKKEGVAGDDKTTKRVTKKNRSKGQKQVVKDKETKTRSQPDEENGTDPINNSEGKITLGILFSLSPNKVEYLPLKTDPLHYQSFFFLPTFDT